jgi:GTP pyrophosphokinase
MITNTNLSPFSLEPWIQAFELNPDDEKRLKQAAGCCQQLASQTSDGDRLLLAGREISDILRPLSMDCETLIAAMLLPFYLQQAESVKYITEQFSPTILLLLQNVEQMQVFSALQGHDRQLSTEQANNLRHMLLAMVEDVRAVVIKLSERVHYIRAIKGQSEDRLVLAAREVVDIYAPLANRLGIGQLKWELEDAAFRILHPDSYQKIARLLAEKRIHREGYVASFVEQLQQALKQEHIHAEVYGRPKHIYSIWKKMDKKSLGFSDLHDVRAVRVVVDQLQDCYGALGIVHTLWDHIPSEFDDYVANPKLNGYQSLHTVALGPDGKSVEIQIRTQQMHHDSELGVAAHWKYKEGTKTVAKGFEEKVAWLRKLLSWQEDVKDNSSLAADIRSQVFEDRVYVFTPKGDVIDLPAGCTPLDFAYYIHSQVGHCCIGAKVDGRIVPFTYRLQNGEQVEVVTAKQPNPKRAWLNPSLGYLNSPRSRSKVQHYFKQLDKGKYQKLGQEQLEAGLAAIDMKLSDVRKVVKQFNVHQLDDLLAAIGAGDIKLSQVVKALQGRQHVKEKSTEFVAKHPPLVQGEMQSEISVEGVGNLLTHMAGCCQPIPGDRILGFITHGRGISVHRYDCEQLEHLLLQQGERAIEVSWGSGIATGYTLDLQLYCLDSSSLIHDITNLLLTEKTKLLNITSQWNKSAQLLQVELRIEVESLDKVSRLLQQLQQLSAVVSARRSSH